MWAKFALTPEIPKGVRCFYQVYKRFPREKSAVARFFPGVLTCMPLLIPAEIPGAAAGGMTAILSFLIDMLDGVPLQRNVRIKSFSAAHAAAWKRMILQG